ncbi:MAG: electron transfer flavoprotein-ubiquinone oxidoreductase [marine bacterium B5-7]|nr:MAG: electron transfer flavoprotein-ubiquinone oxidoreductase [marine bacterium B5-7]
MSDSTQEIQRESMQVDVVIVGAGPAGLAAAIRLMQLGKEADKELSVVVLEKGSEVGAHILSGAVIQTRALDELLPDWKSAGAPLNTEVTTDEVYFLRDSNSAQKMPNSLVPKTMHNDGNYIVSLGAVVRWLGEQAEALGVEIYPGFPAAEILYNEDGSIKGVATGDMGIAADGTHKSAFEPGMELHGRCTLFAEGCRGHLGKQLIERFNLDSESDPQHYGIGLKELWEIDPALHQPGLVVHGAGWPLSETGSSGGFFLYHLDQNQVALGIIIDLNYSNPYLSTFDELQRLKTHPQISKYLEGGNRLSYGARAITKGGFNALPKMDMPGGLLIGCDAGTLNFSKIKGTHTAMKSGMLAAETVFDALDATSDGAVHPEKYAERFKSSWLYDELYRSRNFGPALHKFGPYVGGGFNYVDQNWFGGKLPFTLHDRSRDYEGLKSAQDCQPVDYPKADNKLTFDKLSSVALTNTYHEENQPVHLKLGDNSIPIEVNLKRWDEPAQRYCPAGVYEVVEDASGRKFQINAQNCIHCKTCDIKDPSQNITWVSPEGGGGPNYPAM